ncbi:hypothetical protein KUTeg_022799 [Tegillarca granosa]|uniref:Uncharacterized protein n=1 Tax=Tegillarca granosa TaxID=220873 RepID=A0ABQ9E3K1_TEGGR|nr:hypothetical protein KUTeg_022799 [Tegillarca granosa]
MKYGFHSLVFTTSLGYLPWFIVFIILQKYVASLAQLRLQIELQRSCFRDFALVLHTDLKLFLARIRKLPSAHNDLVIMANELPIRLHIDIDENNINESALKVLEIVRPSWDKHEIRFTIK